MSATVVTTYARTPIDEILSVESVNGLSDADLKQRYGMIWAPGQLWERVAEGRKINYDVYPWQCLDAVNGFPRQEFERGMPLGASVNPSSAQGIIRAGVRVK